MEIPRHASAADGPLRVLHLEDEPADAAMLRAMLDGASGPAVELRTVSHLIDASRELDRETPDVLLADLSLPDSRGLDTVQDLLRIAPSLPIVVLTGLDDERVGLEALRAGAQDFLVKGRIDGELLVRSLRYAIERHRLLRSLQETRRELDALGRLLPVCSSCKKIRDRAGRWRPVDEHVREIGGAPVTHSLCPVCLDALAPAPRPEPGGRRP